MKKSTKLTILAGVTMSIAAAPLAGSAYFCECPAPECVASATEPTHKTKDIQDSDLLKSLGITAKSCVLMDRATGKIIIEKNKSEKLPMASMTKMMTLLITMEEIERGNLSLDQMVMVSDTAAEMEGSECFLDANKPYSVRELIKSVVVASANDSTVALAETIAGTEGAFVKKMNDKAKALGLNNTTYVNSTGLDESGHLSTAEDLAKLIAELERFGELKEFSKVWMYDMAHAGGRVTNLTNTNRLIRTNPDLVFAKTGHTDAAGYCITAMGEREGTTLIACVMGVQDSATRFREANALLNFGFSTYKTELLVDNDNPVGEIKIKNGKSDSVKVYPKTDLAVLKIKGDATAHNISMNLPETVDAPIAEGECLGTLTLTIGGETYTTDIVAREPVQEKTIFDIMRELA